MGAFDKDKQSGLRADNVFGLGTPFVLVAVDFPGEMIETKVGDAERAYLCGAALHPAGHTGPAVWTNTVASAVVEKLRDVEPEELPAVVMLQRVEVNRDDDDDRSRTALVLTYVRDYTSGRAPAIPAR